MLTPDFPPLILTLALPPDAQAYFDALRTRHFPPERNYLRAHLTLFHHLPGAAETALSEQLTTLAAHTPPLPLAVTGLQSLGRGVAFRLESPPLRHLHRQLQLAWAATLTPQDQQPLRPHVTVQNKVDPAVARALLATLTADFAAFETVGTGLQLWAYRGGPWEARRTFAFTAPPAAAASLPEAP